MTSSKKLLFATSSKLMTLAYSQKLGDADVSIIDILFFYIKISHFIIFVVEDKWVLLN